MTKILSVFSLSLALLALSACGGAHVYVEEVYYDDYGYVGDQVAGQTYSVSHIELGINSGNVYSLDPASLQISFDVSAQYIATAICLKEHLYGMNLA